MIRTLTPKPEGLWPQRVDVQRSFRAWLLAVAAGFLAVFFAGAMDGNTLVVVATDSPLEVVISGSPMSAPVLPGPGGEADCAVHAYCTGFLPADGAQDSSVDAKSTGIRENPDFHSGRIMPPASPPPKLG
jgi:hypothetical protein